jgi:hypothetical protein
MSTIDVSAGVHAGRQIFLIMIFRVLNERFSGSTLRHLLA